MLFLSELGTSLAQQSMNSHGAEEEQHIPESKINWEGQEDGKTELGYDSLSEGKRKEIKLFWGGYGNGG